LWKTGDESVSGILFREFQRAEFGNSKLVDPALAKGIDAVSQLGRQCFSRDTVEEALAVGLNDLSRRECWAEGIKDLGDVHRTLNQIEPIHLGGERLGILILDASLRPFKQRPGHHYPAKPVD
jgi:hypothetical protein